MGIALWDATLQIHRLHRLVLPQGARELDPLCLDQSAEQAQDATLYLPYGKLT